MQSVFCDIFFLYNSPFQAVDSANPFTRANYPILFKSDLSCQSDPKLSTMFRHQSPNPWRLMQAHHCQYSQRRWKQMAASRREGIFARK
jgi:hypothetical protein